MAGNQWFRLGLDAWALGIEASAVITLRTLKILSGGPAAEVEARRMVDEKVQTAAALQSAALTGGLGSAPLGAAAKVISRYRREVRANRRRLIKGKV